MCCFHLSALVNNGAVNMGVQISLLDPAFSCFVYICTSEIAGSYSSSVLCLVAQSCLTLCDPMDCSLPGSSVHGDSPGKNAGLGCHAVLQGIFPLQGLNPGLLHCKQILFHLSHQESPWNHNYDSYTGTIVVFQSLSQVPLLVTTWTAAHQVFLSFTISQSLLKLMCIELMIPSNHLSLCHPLLFLPSIFPSIRDFSNEWALGIRWPKDWSFSFSTSPSNEYSQLISFGIDWLNLHAVQRSLKSLLQHYSSKASILWHLAFFMVQLSHPYMTTEKTIALTRQTFVSKVMSQFLIC